MREGCLDISKVCWRARRIPYLGKTPTSSPSCMKPIKHHKISWEIVKILFFTAQASINIIDTGAIKISNL